MNLQPILEDDLIILKPLREEHFEVLYKVAKDPLIWEQHTSNDRYEREGFTDFFTDSIESKGAFIIIDKLDGKAIGSTRFNKIKGVESAIEVGWSFLSRDKWGGKYNKSMKTLMIDYALEFVEDVVLYIAKDNIRSQKAVLKIGGKKVVEPNLKHLIKKSETNWTYRINIKDWKRDN